MKRPFIITKYIQVAGIAALFFLSIACGNNNTANGDAAKADTAAHDEHEHEEENIATLNLQQIKTAGIATGAIEMRNLSGTIKVNGMLDVPPQQLVSVSPPMGGFVKSSALLQGKRVGKGQVVAVMQDPAYIQMQQDYAESVSQLEFLKAEYERQSTLSAEEVTAKKSFQQAKANYNSMMARVNGLKEKLRLLHINPETVAKGQFQSTINIYAPITGYVTKVNVNLGKYVNSTEVMFEIVDTEHLHAELTVFEKDVPSLKINQKIRLTMANETKERTAHVFLIGREISEDRTVRVHGHLDKEDAELLPGMYFTAYIETLSKELPAVPSDAVLHYEGKNYIFVEEEHHHDEHTPANHSHDEVNYRMVEVQTGVSEAGYTAVELPKDVDIKKAKIVIKGAYDLLSKLKNSEEGGHGHAH